MTMENLRYRPTLEPEKIVQRLAGLFIPGSLADPDMESRIGRLDGRFRIYSACSPHGLWAPGLNITGEMRGTTEIYLPLAEIRLAFLRLFSISLHYDPFLKSSALQTSATWLDLLHRLQPLVRQPNPARILRQLMNDGGFRARFLFSLFLPRHYGGGFNRYPSQLAFLRDWLRANRPKGGVRCLDAACGSGEGTYELALLLLQEGYDPKDIEVQGVTVEPLELFAAAHGWFPHDPERQVAFRDHISPIFGEGISQGITFCCEDLTADSAPADAEYDLILCNGLLGGPLLHDSEQLAGTAARLSARLKQGGILMAADRFHGGWEGSRSDSLRNMLASNGLKVVEMTEGVAGIK